jgi:hypothetical protein
VPSQSIWVLAPMRSASSHLLTDWFTARKLRQPLRAADRFASDTGSQSTKRAHRRQRHTAIRQYVRKCFWGKKRHRCFASGLSGWCKSAHFRYSTGRSQVLPGRRSATMVARDRAGARTRIPPSSTKIASASLQEGTDQGWAEWRLSGDVWQHVSVINCRCHR